MIAVIMGFALASTPGCMKDARTDDPVTVASLIHLKETNKRDHPDGFCLGILDGYELAYRSGDTLRVVFGRNTAECGRPTLAHARKGGAHHISAAWPLSPCIDTPLYGYIEAAYRIMREDGVARFVVEVDGSLIADTSLVPGLISDPFPCGD